MDKKKLWKRTHRFLSIWGIITLGFLIELVIESYPELPKKLNDWILVLLFGPPIWLLANLVLEYFIGEPIARGLDALGEKRIRTINKVLAGIIIIPMVILLLCWIFSII